MYFNQNCILLVLIYMQYFTIECVCDYIYIYIYIYIHVCVWDY